jgi:hypothetical protein
MASASNMIIKILVFGYKLVKLINGIVVDLSLNVIEHDVQKSLFHLAHVVWILMVEKIELNHPVSELMRSPNLRDFVKLCYQL